MPCPLGPDGSPYGRLQSVMRVISGQQSAHVRLVRREKAVPHLAIGCETKPIAIQAKRPAYRSNKADAIAVRKFVERSWSTRIPIGNGSECAELCLKHSDHLVGSQHLIE